jgi:SH3-like domain-containing protein
MRALNQINCFKHPLTLGLATFASLVFSFSAHALEFRSVAPAKAILYDAPSLEATKLYILNAGYPVEIIVNLGDWLKVRDQQGSLSWIENKHLSAKRTVLVIEKTDIKSTENANAALLATVDKDVALELVSPVIQNGWVKVKHRDGIIGFVQASALWGVN